MWRIVAFALLYAVVYGKVVSTVTNAAPKQKSRFEEITQQLSASINRIITGVTTIIPNGMEAMKIRQLVKKEPQGVSFLEWKKVEQFSEDVSKVMRLAITIPLSPELFFYSYLVAPMFSPTNPFAWISLPSVFDTATDREKRKSICIQRRFYSIVNALQIVRKEIIDDFSPDTRTEKLDNLGIALEALQAPSKAKALEVLTPWCCTEKSSKRTASTLRVLGLGGAIIKDCCRCIGIDGLPNIPLIRRFNIGELNRYCTKVNPR